MADDLVTWLLGWFAARQPDVALGADQNFFEAQAIDSFGVIELVEAVEDHCAVRFTQEDFQDRRFATAAGIAAMVAEKRLPAGGR